MTRVEAKELLDLAQAGDPFVTMADITLALRATGDLDPYAMVKAHHARGAWAFPSQQSPPNIGPRTLARIARELA